MDLTDQNLETFRFFLERGFTTQNSSWMKMEREQLFPAIDGFPAASINVIRMIAWDEDIDVWHATYGQTFDNKIRWRSPGFPDPVAAYVYAELNQWGR